MQISSSSSALPKMSSTVFVVRYINTVECLISTQWLYLLFIRESKDFIEFLLFADSSLSKLLYLPLEELQAIFFEPD